MVTIASEESLSEDGGSTNFSCNSSTRETRFLQKQLAAAAMPFGWSDISQKPQEMNCIIMRKLCSRNQYHLSLLRSLRASQVWLLHIAQTNALATNAGPQNVLLRMSVSSGFRKFRSTFAPLSRLATAITNHPQSATMSVPPVVESRAFLSHLSHSISLARIFLTRCS